LVQKSLNIKFMRSLDKIIAFVRRRSREEWQREARLAWENSRAWIQVNGEISAVLALLTGVVIVLEFRIFLTALFLLAVLAFFVWLVALPESQLKSLNPPKKDESGPE
jgi:hypothetical protein